jgi:hypothetical protein
VRLRRIRVATVCAAITLASVSSPVRASEQGLLPDLRQAPVGCSAAYPGDPASCTDWDVCVVTNTAAPNGTCAKSGIGRGVRLRFTTAEENVGEGPLLLYGHRENARSTTMQVRQALQSGQHGSVPTSYAQAQRSTAASMYYEPAPMHQHWHLMGFEHMELRTPDGDTVVTDRKNGFCLGDRYRTADADLLAHSMRDSNSPEGQLAKYLESNQCGYQDPQALDMIEGISVGGGDVYVFGMDFQWLDITRVPSGVYDLVNTVNADQSLIEARYDNNSSSIAVLVKWPPGARIVPGFITAPPTVTLLRSCPGKQRCAAR